MRIAIVGEGLLERFLLAIGLVPTPIVDTLQTFLFARAILAGVRLGVFECLAEGPATGAEVARRLSTEPYATEKLLGALVAARYLRYGHKQYWLTRVARKWLLAESTRSLCANMRLRALEWQAMDHLEEFVRTGCALDVHDRLTASDNDSQVQQKQWEVYISGMRSIAGIAAEEVARRTPVPPGAAQMLDVGGAHGDYAAAFCRRHPRLRATVLDLPPAIANATHGLQHDHLAGRIALRCGNALTDDMGQNEWDIVFMSQLVHHFEATANRELVRRAAQALRPGGVLAILEMLRPATPRTAGQSGMLLDMFFAVTSRSGTWSAAEIQAWQSAAGLHVKRPVLLRTMPGAAILVATKRRAGDRLV